MKIFASMDDCPKKVGDIVLAPDGFIAECKGVKAGCVDSIKGIKADVATSFLVDEADNKVRAWVFAKTQAKLVLTVKAKVK